LPRQSTAPGPAGLHRLAQYFLLVDGLLLFTTALLFRQLKMSIVWSTVAPNAVMISVVFGVWLAYSYGPRRERPRVIAETLLATGLLLLYVNIVSPAQYPAVAWKRPLIDPWLARADRALGIHVPSLVAWTRAHPWTSRALSAAYFTLLPQFALPMLLVGLRFQDRSKLWEYLFHFHVCLGITLLAVGLFPAECAFTHYGFVSTIDQTRFIRQFAALRSGTLTAVRFDALEGLISMPSFHVAGGLIVTWAFRGRSRWMAALAIVNAGLIAATVMSGAHYFIDVVATFVMVGGSLWLYRALGIERMTGAAEPGVETISAAVA